jgi:hypothetical protein
MYIVTHKFTQHVKKNQFFFLRGIILPLSPLYNILFFPTSRAFGLSCIGLSIYYFIQINIEVKFENHVSMLTVNNKI